MYFGGKVGSICVLWLMYLKGEAPLDETQQKTALREVSYFFVSTPIHLNSSSEDLCRWLEWSTE